MIADEQPINDPAAVTAKARDLGRNFLASLFMATRTAQIHDPSNQAFEQAVQAVLASAQSLFQVTGGFSLRFVEDTVFLNGTRLRFEGGTYSSAQTLRAMLSERGLGGLELHKPPSPNAIRDLVMLFAPHAGDDQQARAQALVGEIRMLGLQRFQDQRADVRIDRRVMVVQSYGKLILALRERVERVHARAHQDAALGPPRLKPVRVMQDLVELCEDRADFLLRLAANHQGAPRKELFGVNTSLLSLVMGHAIGLPRQDLVDIGLAALFMPLGFDGDTFAGREAQAAVVRLLADSGISRATYIRCIVLGEQAGLTHLDVGSPPHPYARMVQCAAAYQQLVLGLSDRPPLHPLAALARLHNDQTTGLDYRWIDLLINVLRAFPKGTQVVLDNDATAEVLSQIGGTRWDRPMVRVHGPQPGTHDLMIQDEGRFIHRIRATAYYLGRAEPAPLPLEEEVPSNAITFDDFPTGVPTERQDPLQVPLLTATDLSESMPSDTDASFYAPPEATVLDDFEEPGPVLPASALTAIGSDDDDAFGMDSDALDITQADGFDASKTQETFTPVDWDE